MEHHKRPDGTAPFSGGANVADPPSLLFSIPRQFREYCREIIERWQNPPVCRYPEEVRDIWGRRRYKAQAFSFAGYAILLAVVAIFPSRAITGSPNTETVIPLALNRPLEAVFVPPPPPVAVDTRADEGSAATDGSGAPKVRRPEVAPPAKPANKEGGGGGGGKQDSTPASGGPPAPFAPVQLAVPMPKAMNNDPLLAATPTLVSANAEPYKLDLSITTIGDPFGKPTAPPSSGGGTGGGIGEGNGRGIGDDDRGGAGLGPGCCMATGDDTGDSVPARAGLVSGPGDRRGNSPAGGNNVVRGSITEPRVIHQTKPPYSEAARKAKVQGTVVLEVRIREDGAVDGSSIRVVKSQGYGLDESAIQDVLGWRFKAATLDGRPIPRTVRIEVNFALH